MTYNKSVGFLSPDNNTTPNLNNQPYAGIALQAQVFKARQPVFCLQFLVKFYNATNLRILYDFDTRGPISGSGNNLFLKPIATGQNWQASSTEPGFPETNLNTDIVEQYWRGANAVSAITITMDSEAAQGILIDTLCFLNHNLSSNATITWQRSNSSVFATTDDIELEITEENIYWIAPELPTTQYRYHRFLISDPSKVGASDFISIGTIIGGQSFIMLGENIVDSISFNWKEYSDKIETEGYQNVTNSRAIKRNLVIDFQSLLYSGKNYSRLRDIFKTYRTSHKMMWIPTPSATNQDVTDRFAVFGKLALMPQQLHNYKDDEHQYVTFTCEVDESL